MLGMSGARIVGGPCLSFRSYCFWEIGQGAELEIDKTLVAA